MSVKSSCLTVQLNKEKLGRKAEDKHRCVVRFYLPLIFWFSLWLCNIEYLLWLCASERIRFGLFSIFFLRSFSIQHLKFNIRRNAP